MKLGLGFEVNHKLEINNLISYFNHTSKHTYNPITLA